MPSNQKNNEDFAELLAGLTWVRISHVYNLRAVERITGLAKSTIRQGLGLGPDPGDESIPF